MKVLVAVPEKGFDPTELGVPCKLLRDHGVDIVVMSPSGTTPVRADPIMVDGVGLYLLKWSMRADPNGIAAYTEILNAGLLEKPLSYAAVLRHGRSSSPPFAEYDALLLPGGHCPDMRPYLEDSDLQALVREFSATGKVVAAVCHGVVLAARSGILAGKAVTALPSWMESLAYGLTRLWMGGYYKTYKETTVEREVTEACRTYLAGPRSLKRDSPAHLDAGFVVQDGSLLTARWPGDCHRFGEKLWELIREKGDTKPICAT